jgi:cytochrome c oxidase subunit 2
MLALAATGADATFWLPAERSTFAGRVDSAFYVIFWICVLFFLLILAMAAFMLVKYRRRGDVVEVARSAHHNTVLEITWSAIPLVIVLAIFVMGFRGYIDLRTPPQNTYDIQVTAQKWAWSFQYPNGYEDSELHVPAGVPVKLTMTSRDVIHCLYVPAFRTKQDVVPGRYTMLWFQAIAPGESPIFCAEYCGTKHSQMLSKVIVHDPADFDAWMAKAGDWMKGLAPAEAGAVVYTKKGCVQCHSVNGAAGVGPTFLGSFGKSRKFADGSTGVADENYVRESLLNPRAKVVTGFDPVMPTFQGRLKETEITALIAYLKSLSR